MKNILYIGNPLSIHDVKWASFFSITKKYNVFFISESYIAKKEKNLKNELLKKDIILLDFLNPFIIKKPIKTITSILKLRRIIIKHNIDIVHILFSTPYSLWALFVSKPTVITNRGSDILVELPKLNTMGLKGKIFKYLFKKVFKKSIITATSLKLINPIKNMFNIEQVFIVRTGVDVEKIADISLKTKKKKIIFFPRFLSPIYNTDLQLNAINLLPKNIIKQYKFYFIDGINHPDIKYRNKMIEKMKKLRNSIGLKFKVISPIEPVEMYEIYSSSDLTIMTPLSDGTPNSALEAMAAKCPLIIPNLNYDKDLFDRNCYILQNSTPNELSLLISKVLNNNNESITKKAFDDVTKNGNRKIEMGKINDIYNHLLNNNK